MVGIMGYEMIVWWDRLDRWRGWTILIVWYIRLRI